MIASFEEASDTMDDGNAFSTRAYFDRVAAGLQPSLTFSATTIDEWREWRIALRARLKQLMGSFPDEAGDLNPRVTDQCEETTYTRERIVFESEPGTMVSAYLLRPHRPRVRAGTPAVLCLHGHGRGKDDVAGIASTLRERQKWIRSLNYDYGHQLVERGYTVLIPDARCFGERGTDGMDCIEAATAALLVGKTLVGLRTWDTIRAIDFLQSLPEVDPSRIACVGLSWGGTQTMYTAALDERVRVSVISGAFGTFKDALIDASECPCQYVPRLLGTADLPDIVSLIAPRPLLLESGTGDQHYTIEVVRDAYRTVERAYEVVSAPAHVAIDIFDGGHRFNGEKALPWLDRWL